MKVYFSLTVCVCILTCTYGYGQLLTVKITSKKKKELVKNMGGIFYILFVDPPLIP